MQSTVECSSSSVMYFAAVSANCGSVAWNVWLVSVDEKALSRVNNEVKVVLHHPSFISYSNKIAMKQRFNALDIRATVINLRER